MAKTTLFKGVVYLSDEQYNKLITDGVIEVGGQTITYDESMVYITPKALPTDYYTKEEIEEKLSQTISKPLIVPTATEIVAVDNTNSQTMLTIGDGLSVENGTLKASGGASGDKLYTHNIVIIASENNLSAQIITKTNSAFTGSSLAAFLVANGLTGDKNFLGMANGITNGNNNKLRKFFGIYTDNATLITTIRTETSFIYNSETNSISTSTSVQKGSWQASDVAVYDTVWEI